MKYQENLQKYLDNAKNLSLINHHEFVTCEHVLFALLKLSTDFKDIFEEFSDGDLELLETELKNYISQNNQVIKQEIEPTISVVLDEILLSSKNKNNEIKIIDFLEKLIQDSRSYSSYLLKKHNINLNKIQELQNHENIQNLNNHTSDCNNLINISSK